MKNILVTGAGRGIGFAIAKAVVPYAHNLILVTKSHKSFKQLQHNFPKAKNFKADLSKEKELLNFIKNVHRQIDYLDVLINNAGFYLSKMLDETRLNDLDELYKIHLKAPFVLTKGFVNLLQRSKFPQVINISSAANYARIPSESAYTAVKAGLTALGDVLRNELQKYNIRFTTIHPWTVASKKLKNNYKYLRSEDIAETVVFLINTHHHCQVLNIELSSVIDWRGNWPPWISG